MTIEEFKSYALRTLCEEHLWKIDEWDRFTIGQGTYELKRNDKGFQLAVVLSKRYGKMIYGKVKTFPRMSELFSYIFRLHDVRLK